MSVKIRKQVLNDQGLVIEEYEGTEEEVEAYEKKRAKRSQTESAKKQRTVLHGKDLEDIRGVVKEELAKLPPPVQLVPFIQPAPVTAPLNPWLTPTWSPYTITFSTDTVQVPSPAAIQEPANTAGGLYGLVGWNGSGAASLFQS